MVDTLRVTVPPSPRKTFLLASGRTGVYLTSAARWRSGKSAKDPRLFKLIISPEFGERMDLVAHTKALMEGMGQDLGKQLDWVAVVHQNTDHPHVHVALRGISKDGQEIKLPREYIQKGIRLRAEDLATAQLGIRTEADIAEAHRREVIQRRFTPLDRAIAKQQPVQCKGAGLPCPSQSGRPHFETVSTPARTIPCESAAGALRYGTCY